MAPSSGKISAITPNFWQSCNRIRGCRRAKVHGKWRSVFEI